MKQIEEFLLDLYYLLTMSFTITTMEWDFQCLGVQEDGRVLEEGLSQEDGRVEADFRA